MDVAIFFVAVTNMLFTAVCAYCLCVALTRNSLLADDQTRYLRHIHVWLKYFIRIGGFTFIAWVAFLGLAAL